MANVNIVILAGNITRDIEMKFVGNDQTAICDFGLAVNRKRTDRNGNQQEDAMFVDCTAFGRTAEIINQYCSKGSPLHIEGRLKYESWEDKNGGGKRSKLKVEVKNVQLLGSLQGNGGNGGNRNSNGGGNQGRQQQRPQGNRNQQQRQQQNNNDDDWRNDDAGFDDVPW